MHVPLYLEICVPEAPAATQMHALDHSSSMARSLPH